MPYPVTFRADYVEKRSRLTTFFRLILAIPHFIAVTLYFLAAEVVVIISWFALLFTGRYPQGMYDFVAGALRYQTRVYGYAALLSDQYPPFSGDPATPYPVDLVIGPPKAEYSRMKVLFRIILAIPVLIIQYAMQIVAQVGAFLAWWAILFLGRQPKGLQDMIVLGLSYQQRATVYLALITEDWPPFTDDTTGRSVEAAPAFGALASSPPAAGPEHPTSVPPGGYASPEREAAFPSAPAPLPPRRGRGRAAGCRAAGRRAARVGGADRGRAHARAARVGGADRGRAHTRAACAGARARARAAGRAGPVGADPRRSARRDGSALPGGRAAGRAQPTLPRRLARPRARARPALARRLARSRAARAAR